MLLAAGVSLEFADTAAPAEEPKAPVPAQFGRQAGAWARIASQQRSTPEADVIEVWPDVVQVLDLFIAVDTQWRYSPGGFGVPILPIGLDYQGVRASPAFVAIPEADREEVFASLCVMERAFKSEKARRASERMNTQET